MSSRKMWADVDWATNTGGTYMHAKRVHTSVPVLVTDAKGAPDFGPGDMVRHRYSFKGREDQEVEGVYVDSEGEWSVVLTDGEYDRASVYERVPREVTKLVRVTGPEDKTKAALLVLASGVPLPEGVRVEIVEEER